MSDIFSIIVTTLLVRIVALILYRLYFHPLAKFPGPKYLGITTLGELYHDVIRGGQFPAVITALHQKHGPIVRISPNEVSINDKSFQNDFFHKDKNLRKDPRYYNFGFNNGLFVTLDKRKHMERKRHFVSLMQLSGPYFIKFHPLIAEKIGDLKRAVNNAARNEDELNLSILFRKICSDIALEFSLGPEKFPSREHAEDAVFMFSPAFRYMASLQKPLLVRFLYRSTPTWVFKKFVPPAAYVREAEAGFKPLLRRYTEMDADGKASLSPGKPKPFMYALLDSSNLYAESNYQTSIEEFIELLWASREGIGHALTTVSYYLMLNPQCMAKLREELRNTDLDLAAAPYAQLRGLPYLNSVCKECLRLIGGNKLRQPRISPYPVEFQSWMVPAGCAISASQDFTHRNAHVFPEPDSFRPERWLETTNTKEMDRCFNPFGYGSRACGGQSLTYEVIWRSVANIFVDFSFQSKAKNGQPSIDSGALDIFPGNNTPCIIASVARYDQ